MKPCAMLLLLAAALPALAAPKTAKHSGHEIYLNETVISGNQELPRVLYILPWRTDPGEALEPRAPALDTGRILQPVYPDEFRREMASRALIKAIPKH